MTDEANYFDGSREVPSITTNTSSAPGQTITAAGAQLIGNDNYAGWRAIDAVLYTIERTLLAFDEEQAREFGRRMREGVAATWPQLYLDQLDAMVDRHAKRASITGL